ncbi:hypothetical protein BFP71_09620 [Roseivirga misakiensis]|uniref:Transporter permease n=2 Tax=Roseivirga misakiensis TaxID=1563681 RepID=A0A1E5T2C9_9BACT|nr:hypothetical protein BFP71_09620 [Roseivirga misakiensis]
MIKHYILISFRSFKRYRSTFLINLFGLATGLASALMIYLWVNDELHMGQFEEKDSDRHFQVLVNTKYSSDINTKEYALMPLAKAMEEEFPEVEKGIPVMAEPYYKGVLSHEGNDLWAVPIFAGDGYFDIFQSDFLAGNKANALDNNGVVISTKLANSLFRGAENAMGKTVQFKGEYHQGPFVVTGVFKPAEDDIIPHDILLSFDHFLSWRPENNNWNNGGTQVHLVLKDGVDIDQFNAKIYDILDKFAGYDDKLFVQKYSDKYLYGKYVNGVPVAGRIVYVKIFSLIAVFILIIACINYMNLSTAQASRRVKEIGVKKAIGAQRRALIYQFFSESIFITFLSLLLAVGIATIFLPSFNTITGKSLAIGQASHLVLPALTLTILTGLIAGIYPGLYLSGFKPVLALKGKLQASSGGLWLRKGLVVFQFATSVVLVISAVVIYQQMSFISASNLGYDQEQLVSFNRDGKLYEGDAEAFMGEVRNLSGVVSMSYLWGELPGQVSGGSGMQWEDMDREAPRVDFSFIEGGYEMAEVLGVEFKEGRSLSKEFATDEVAVVLNESAAQIIGYDAPVGRRFYNGHDVGEVVGLVKDFHFEGFQKEIGPFFFMYSEDGDRFMTKIRPENQMETIRAIEKLHESFNPGYPFIFEFVDDSYQQVYLEEKRISTLSKYFSGIAITISCLGLLALTAFSTQRRFKEIAIRKVLGSSNSGIMRLLSKEFTVLVLLAILIAVPIGFYLMKNWLDGFAYRISLEPVYFVLSGVVMLLFAWLTIVSQTAKSASVNITESLRSE